MVEITGHPKGVLMAHHSTRGLIAALAISLLFAATAEAKPISYATYFQDPGAVPGQDFSLENRAVELIDATPAGERITFAFRDYNRDPIVDALIAARCAASRSTA